MRIKISYFSLVLLLFISVQLTAQVYLGSSIGLYVGPNANATFKPAIVLQDASKLTINATGKIYFSQPITVISGDINVNGNIELLSTDNQTLSNFNMTVKDLTIGANAKLTISSTKYLTVNGTFINNGNDTSFVIQSNSSGTGSLLHNSTVAGTMQRYISGSAEAWHFMSSPVAAQSISGTWTPSGAYGNGTGYDLYVWNEPTNCWIYKLNTTSTVNWSTIHPGSNFTVGRGYLYSVLSLNPTKAFAGNLNNGSINYDVTKSSAEATLRGFNLIGNPYPSSIDWQAVSGWTRTNLKSSGSGYDMWIWNQTANNYGVCNSASGSGTNGISRYIAPMQGFFVRAANAGSISTTNAVRVHNGAGAWLKNTEDDPTMISLIVQSHSDNSFDEVRLQFGYTSNFSGATKLFSHITTAPSLYMQVGIDKYSVRYLTDTIENPKVPLLFKSGKDGDYTIKCNFDVDRFEMVMLEDRQMHFIQNMKSKNTYTFKSLVKDDANRFVLHFGPDANENNIELPVRIYDGGGQLVIDLSLVSKETEALVYNNIGQLLYQTTLQGEMLHTLNINAKSQMLIVSLKNPQGSVCRKLLFNKP